MRCDETIRGDLFVKWLESREVRPHHLKASWKRQWSHWVNGQNIREDTVDKICSDRGLHIDEIPDWVFAGVPPEAVSGLERVVVNNVPWWVRR